MVATRLHHSLSEIDLKRSDYPGMCEKFDPSELQISAPLLVTGDCTDEIPKIIDNSVHLIVTDPPYFLDGLNSDWRKGTGETPRGTGSVGGLPAGMRFDPRQGLELEKFIRQVGAQMLKVLVPGAFCVVFSAPRLVHRMAVGLEDAGFEIRDMYAWHYTQRAQSKAFSMDHFIDRRNISDSEKVRLKETMRGRKTAQLRPQFQSIILAQKPRLGTLVNNWVEFRTGLFDSTATLDGKAPSTVMTVEKPEKDQENDHLTPKPVLLIEHLIRLFSEAGQVVLDPFLGSGTTAVAALRTGRACIGIEINPGYTLAADRRIKKEANE